MKKNVNEILNDVSDLFKPFTSKNRAFHYRVIKSIIDLSIRFPELYETDVLLDINSKLKEEPDLLDESGSIITPSQELRYLRANNWIVRDLGNNGENLANTSDNGKALFHFIENTFIRKKGSAELSNLLLNIHGASKQLVDNTTERYRHPYLNGIYPIYEDTIKLRNELRSLILRIKDTKPTIAGIKRLEGINDFILNNPATKNILQDYMYVTQHGSFTLLIDDIRRWITEFMENEDLCQKALEEYIQDEELDYLTARENFDGMCNTILYYFPNGYDDDVDKIQTVINDMWNIVNQRLVKISRYELNGFDSDLESLLLHLKEMDDEDKELILKHAFDNAFNIYDNKFVGLSSLREPRRRIQRRPPHPVSRKRLSHKEKEDGIRNTVESNKSPYTPDECIKYLNNLLGPNNVLIITSDDIKSEEDVKYLVSSAVAATDKTFPFIITKLRNESVENYITKMMKLRIERKIKWTNT